MNLRQWFIFGLVSVVHLVLPVLTARADHCLVRPVYGYQQAYVQQQHYVAPVKTVYQYEKVLMPLAVRAFISPDYYFSIDGYSRDKLLADAVAERVRKESQASTAGKSPCDEQVAELRRELRALQAKLIGEQPTEPAKVEPTKPTGGSSGGVPAGLAKVVEASCLRCHGAENSGKGGGFDMRDLAAVTELKRLRSFSAVNVGLMPKGGEPLKTEEVQLFYEWAEMARKVGK